MSHFYGTLEGSRGKATRCGSKASGLGVAAASWHGAIYVDVWHNAQIGLDCFRVTQTPWHGVGVTEVIAQGILGRLQDDEAGIDAFQKEV